MAGSCDVEKLQYKVLKVKGVSKFVLFMYCLNSYAITAEFEYNNNITTESQT